jgi:hypothetical protein
MKGYRIVNSFTSEFFWTFLKLLNLRAKKHGFAIFWDIDEISMRGEIKSTCLWLFYTNCPSLVWVWFISLLPYLIFMPKMHAHTYFLSPQQILLASSRKKVLKPFHTRFMGMYVYIEQPKIFMCLPISYFFFFYFSSKSLRVLW